MNTYDNLKSFLTSRRAWSKFVYNYNIQSFVTGRTTKIKNHCNNFYSMTECIVWAFAWRKTKEGFAYWQNLRDEAYMLYIELNI